MCKIIPDVFLMPRRRKPVRLRPLIGMDDLQALPPPDWCPGCGAELFRPERTLCHRCRQKKGSDGCANQN